MKDLSFHITDIASNSIRAQATQIEVSLQENKKVCVICIRDNGIGMDAATLSSIRNPFYTSRTKRKVGLGLPFLIQNAEQTGGNVTINSTLGKGTQVSAVFNKNHIDCPPLGDLAGTIALLITGNPDISFLFSYHSIEKSISINTEEIRNILEDLPLSHPQVMVWIKEMISENIKE